MSWVHVASWAARETRRQNVGMLSRGAREDSALWHPFECVALVARPRLQVLLSADPSRYLICCRAPGFPLRVRVVFTFIVRALLPTGPPVGLVAQRRDQSSSRTMPEQLFVTSFWFYIVSVPALLLTSISKGGFGLGLGIVAVPLMSLCLPVTQVVTILLPILCVTDLVAVWQYRGEWDWSLLRIVVPSALVGVFIGMLMVHRVDERWLRLSVGLTSVVYAMRRGTARGRERFSNDDKPPTFGRRPLRAVLWGMISGFTSFLANAGEPALTMFLLPHRLGNRTFAATTAAFFAIVNLCKLASFFALGEFNATALHTSALLAPVAFIGIYVGIHLNARLNARLFSRCSRMILLTIGVRLVYTAIKKFL